MERYYQSIAAIYGAETGLPVFCIAWKGFGTWIALYKVGSLYYNTANFTFVLSL